ncbi:MAG: glutathione synthase [Planctomycetota bacterium]
MAVQTMKWLYIIDPFETLNPETDTTYAIMRESAQRSIPSYICTIQDLHFTNKAAANVRRIAFGPSGARLGDVENQLLDDFNLILMRKEPPYDLAFHYATALLSLTKTPVLNSPEALRNFNEKLIILNFPHLIPGTFVSADIEELERFAEDHRDGVMVKALDSYQGKMVYKLKSDDVNFHDLLQASTRGGTLPIMLQEYIHGISEGDKRIILLSEKILGALKRMPAAGAYISNLGAGGTEHKTAITAKEQELVAAIAPFLIKHGIHFAGLDVISEKLTEVNITCPTGLQHVNRLEGKCLEKEVVDRFQELARQ